MARGYLVGQGSSRGCIRFYLICGYVCLSFRRSITSGSHSVQNDFPALWLLSCSNASLSNPFHQQHTPTSTSLPWPLLSASPPNFCLPACRHWYCNSSSTHRGTFDPPKLLPPLRYSLLLFMAFPCSPWLISCGPLRSLPCIEPPLPYPPFTLSEPESNSTFCWICAADCGGVNNHVGWPCLTSQTSTRIL